MIKEEEEFPWKKEVQIVIDQMHREMQRLINRLFQIKFDYDEKVDS